MVSSTGEESLLVELLGTDQLGHSYLVPGSITLVFSPKTLKLCRTPTATWPTRYDPRYFLW